MNIILLTQIVFAVIASLLAVIMVLTFMKSLKKDYFPNWKFLDYFSVGYAEHLFIRYIKRQ